MTKHIDEQVVSMQFDNRNFEKNVNTTIESTERLKKSLDFKGVDKGFKNIDSAAAKVDMSTLGRSVETVRAKFSAMEVVAVTALANITNSALNAGKNLVKSLSIDQITAGMSKYEQKTASVQTIMNATGKSIDEVNRYLEKLMWFSDETSYGFTDMTAALGQMTSSGGDIENLIPLITGVANATAYAGKGASEFSRVMYNLNQSYGAGYLQLMDWKSLELAGVGSKQLKQTFIDTAVQMGKIKEGEVTIANFSQTLKDKWADTAVMEKAFGVFGDFTEKVYKLSEDIERGDLSGYSEEIQKLAEAGELETTADMMEALSKEYEGVGKKAFQSAQEAKSFTEAIDATKDAVSSGWMQTFELIFGNYEQAKVLWTELCNNLWDIFASGGESRNALLKKALSYSPLSKFSEKLQQVTETIQAPVKKLQEYEEIVNRIINGEFGNGQARWDKLTEAGYDWAHAQNLVNEKLGDSTRHATNFTEELSKQTEQTVKLTDAKLKELGFTKEEIKMYRELEAESKKTGKSIDELIASMEEADGRTLLLGGFKNIGSGILGMIYAIRDAFNEIFPPMTALQLYNLIKKFNEFTEKLRLTDKKTGELNKTGEKLKRTFKGVFAIFDIILTIVGGPLKIAFKAITTILGKFGLGVLDVTANVGDAIVGFRDWLDSVLDFEKAFDYLSDLFKPAAKKVKEWIDSFKNLPVIQDSIKGLKEVFSGGFSMGPITVAFTKLWEIIVAVGKGIKSCYDAFVSLPAVQNGIAKLSGVFEKLFGGLKNTLGGIDFNSVINGINKLFDTFKKWISSFGGENEKNGEHLMSGLGNAISGAAKVVIDAITSICEAIYNTFTTFFGIHSPSKVFFTLGKFCIAGLVAGLLFAKEDTKAAMGELGSSLISGAQTMVDTIVNIIKGLDLGTILATTGIFGIYKLATKTLSVIELFGKGVEGFGAMCKSAGGVLDAVKEKINPKKTKFENVANSVLKLAGSIAILAGAVYILAQLDSDKLWNGVKAIAALAGIVVVLAVAAKLLKGADGSFAKLAGGLILMSIAIAILGVAMSKLMSSIGGMDGKTLDQATGYLVGFGVFILGLVAIAKFGTGAQQGIKGLTGLLLGVSVVMLAMSKTLAIIGGMNKTELDQAQWYLVGFGVVLLALVGLTKLVGGTLVMGLGALFAGVSATLISMAICIKMLGGLDENTLLQGATVVGTFMIFLTTFISVVGVLCNSAEIAGMAGLFIGVSMALLSMSACIRILGGMSPEALENGMKCIKEFVLLIGLLMLVSMVGSGAKGLAATLLAISVALAVMAGLVVVLGVIPDSVLEKGLTVVVGVGLILAALIAVSKLAENSAGAIWGITAMLGVIVASMLILSHIKPESLSASVDAMGILLSIVALALAASKLAEKSMGSIITMTVLVAALGGVLYLLAGLPADQVMASAVSLSGLLLVVAGVFVLLGTFGSLTSTALAGVVGLLALCVPLLAFVGILHLMEGLDNATNSVIALSTLLVVMSAMLVVLAAVGALVAPALVAVLGMGALVIELGILVAAIGALAQIPGLEWLISEGGNFLQKIGTALGQFVGGIVGGFAQGALSTLPEIGTYLSQFMLNATPFIDGAKAIDSTLFDGVEALAKALLVLTGANILDSLTKWITGGTSMADFGKQLSDFGPYMASFAESVADINPETVVAAAKAAKALAVMADTIPSDWGNNNITNFGDQIVPFGEDITDFASNVEDLNVDNIKTASDAVGMLSNMADSIPKDWGNNNITNFGNQLTDFSSSLITFSSDIGTNSGFINNAVTSIDNFVTSISNIDIEAASSTVSGLKDSMKAIAEGAIKSFSDVFSNAEVQSTTKTKIGNMLSAVSKKDNYSTQYDKFIKVGKYMVQGFAKGITDNTYIAEAKAKAMANKAEEAARKALDEHSPSRVFEGIGKFLVLGFANGIRKNTKNATDSARTMSNDVLEATQDELGIHSPSIVFDKKVGRYIVQGIAEGIKKDTSAEDAARMKADNIVSAFKKEFDKINLEGEIESNEFELWKLGEGRNASDATKYAEEERFLTNEWRRAQQTQDMAWYQLQETEAYYKKGQVKYDDVRKAHNDYVKAQRDTLTAKEEVDNLKKSKPLEALEKTIEDNEKAIEIRSKLQENWLKTEGKYLSGEAQDARLLADSQENLRNYENVLTAEQQKHDLLIQQKETALDKEQVEEDIYESYMRQRELESKIADEKELIAAIQNGASERELENLSNQMEIRDKEFELVKAELGDKVSKDELDNLDRAHLTQELENLNKQVKIEEQQWRDLAKAYKEGTATQEQVDAAYSEYVDAKIKAVDTQNELSLIDENAAKRQKEALEKQYDFASENADIMYQIWEKTEGKKATGAEKDVAKLSTLSEQLLAQSSLLSLARQEWEDAKNEYGRSSTEAHEAYNAYLRKQLDVANLQSEITDINEKTVTRQKAAAAEYKDYIKKYEKYYELNGMSREELEKDAKLVSGYNPSKTVSKMMSNTKYALDNISENPEYRDVMNGFTSLGSSYVGAVDDGVNENSNILVSTFLKLASDCVSELTKNIETWKGVGKQCVEGFVSGIEANIYLAAQAASQMANEAMVAAKEEFDINSPSKAFMNIGMFAAMGLAKGLTDNSYLSNAAASNLGKTAIDNLKESIRHISDFVDSDLDTQPVIRPVLDLSDIKSETAKLNAMFSTSQAMGISASMSNRNRVDESQNGKDDNKSSNKYEFNQYNYSPKALSRAEIYRQTKNQFAAMKGALT